MTTTTARVFAYCRVSTTDQTTENQVREIAGAGFTVEPHRILAETISGSTPAAARPMFGKLIERMERGDVLIVTKLDRLGRNAMDVLATVERLAGDGIKVYCLQLGGMDLTSSAGRMTMGVLTHVAQFERDLLIERTQSGMARAVAEGKTLGRPKAVTEAQKAEIGRRLAAGETVSSLAREFDTSRQTVARCRVGVEAPVA